MNLKFNSLINIYIFFTKLFVSDFFFYFEYKIMSFLFFEFFSDKVKAVPEQLWFQFFQVDVYFLLVVFHVAIAHLQLCNQISDDLCSFMILEQFQLEHQLIIFFCVWDVNFRHLQMWDFVNLEVEFQSLFYILERHLGDLEVVSNCLGVCGERIFILSAYVLVVLTSVVFSTVF